jgi:hypothetical protein
MERPTVNAQQNSEQGSLPSNTVRASTANESMPLSQQPKSGRSVATEATTEKVARAVSKKGDAIHTLNSPPRSSFSTNMVVKNTATAAATTRDPTNKAPQQQQPPPPLATALSQTTPKEQQLHTSSALLRLPPPPSNGKAPAAPAAPAAAVGATKNGHNSNMNHTLLSNCNKSKSGLRESSQPILTTSPLPAALATTATTRNGTSVAQTSSTGSVDSHTIKPRSTNPASSTRTAAGDSSSSAVPAVGAVAAPAPQPMAGQIATRSKSRAIVRSPPPNRELDHFLYIQALPSRWTLQQDQTSNSCADALAPPSLPALPAPAPPEDTKIIITTKRPVDILVRLRPGKRPRTASSLVALDAAATASLPYQQQPRGAFVPMPTRQCPVSREKPWTMTMENWTM